MTTNYARGRAFEYRTRDRLKELGAVYVMRAAGSHTKADLAAFFPSVRGWAHVWLVQCKKDGRLPAEEREKLVSICRQTGAVPVLARVVKGGVAFDQLEE